MTIQDIRPAGRNRGGNSRQQTTIALLPNGVYAVMNDVETMGFIECVGAVFVALDGPDLPRACEIGQTLVWEDAIAIVRGNYLAR